MRRLLPVVLLTLSACGSVRTYQVQTAVNQEVYYHSRYVDACLRPPRRAPLATCNAMADLQDQIDAAGIEATDALKVGGSDKFQIQRLRRLLARARKEFGSWAS
jgi:hypothetical protein